jgi:hypothetical protein
MFIEAFAMLLASYQRLGCSLAGLEKYYIFLIFKKIPSLVRL